MKYGVFIFLGFSLFSTFAYSSSFPKPFTSGFAVGSGASYSYSSCGDYMKEYNQRNYDNRSPNISRTRLTQFISMTDVKDDGYNYSLTCKFSMEIESHGINGKTVRKTTYEQLFYLNQGSACEKGVKAALKANLADPPYKVCGDNKCEFEVYSWEKNSNSGGKDENGDIPLFWGFGIQNGKSCSAPTDLGGAKPKPPYNPEPPKDPPPPPKKGCDDGQAICEQPDGGCGDGYTTGTFNGKSMCIANGKPNNNPPADNGGGGNSDNSSSGGGTPNSGGSNPNASIPNPYLPNTTPITSSSGAGGGGATSSNGSSSANGNHANGGDNGTGGVSFGGHVNGNPNSSNAIGGKPDGKGDGKTGKDDKGNGGNDDKGDGDYPDIPDNPELPLVDLGKNLNLSEKIFNSNKSCPADRTLTLSSLTYTFKFSQWCSYLSIFGYLILIASYIYAINIVSRDI